MKWFSMGASVALVLIMGQILYQAIQSERFHLEQDWYSTDNWGWDPIQALMQLSSNPVLMVLMLFFVLVAQFSTNFTLNILPPALIFEELLGIDWKKSIILVGVLGSLTFPWILLETGTKFINFINYYTAFFGPLLGCMLAQRWLERNPVSVDDLYNADATSRYWYAGGYNLTAIIITALVSVYVMTWHLEISWLVGMSLSLVVYVIIHRLSMMFST